MLLRPLPEQNRSIPKRKLPKKVAFSLMFLSLNAYCQEVEIITALDATGYISDTKIGDDDAVQRETIIINPSIISNYSSRLISASLIADHSIVETSDDSDNESDSDSDSQTYTDFRYTSTLQLVENVLSLSLSGAQSHRSISQQQNFFSDRVLGSEDLTKTQNNNAQLLFVTPNPKYLGINLQSSYSETKADQSQEDSLGFDSNNTGVTARLYQGRKIRALSFDISVQYNDTSRSNFEDFESTVAQGNFGFPVINNIDFIITGSLEEYDTGQSEFARRSDIDTSSYGAGLRWGASDERSISLTYNQLDEGDNTTEFVGLNIGWAFSSRTQLNLDYGKRFFGDAYNFDFSHSLKSIRTSISYSEDVTTFSRLGASNGVNGIFVCQFGSSELTDCFQPESLDYQLQAGEEFRAFTELTTDISEEVLFNKSGTVSIGYEKRKIRMSIDATYRQIEYLESDRLNTDRRLSFNFNYALSRKTDINFVSSITENKISELDNTDTIINTNLDITRDFGRNLQLNLGVRLLDRESDNIERDGTDNRISVGLNYTF